MLRLQNVFILFLMTLLFQMIPNTAYSQITESYRLRPVNSSSAGQSMDIAEDTLIIGATDTNLPGTGSVGAVYVYEIDLDGNLVRQQILTPSDPIENSNFGLNLSISENRIAVGMPSSFVGENQLQGKVYIFEKDLSGTWEEIEIITASDGTEFDNFGGCVALSGERMLITASGADIEGIEDTGKAYIFEMTENGDWNEILLEREGPYSFERFGHGCGLEDDIAVLGASAANNFSGYADIYERDSDGNWNQTQRVTRAEPEMWDQLGHDIDISNGVIIVGIQNAYKILPPTVIGGGIEGYGAIFILERNESDSWNITELTGRTNEYLQFGRGLSTNGNKIIVGAPDSPLDGREKIGNAYIFEKNSNGDWIETNKLIPSNPFRFDFFGSHLAIHPQSNTYITASKFENSAEIYVFNLPITQEPFELLALEPSQVGVENHFIATGATPGGDVQFIWGFTEQIVDGSSLCPNLEVGILNFRDLVAVTADDLGVATFNAVVPLNFAGVTVVLQAIDMTTCSASNVNQETFQNPPPPVPVDILLDPLDPSIAGEINTMSVSSASANGSVTFIWGLVQQSFSDNRLCPGLEAGILNYRILSTVRSDSGGNASYSFVIPGGASGFDIFMQAVDISTCSPSNVNAETIE